MPRDARLPATYRRLFPIRIWASANLLQRRRVPVPRMMAESTVYFQPPVA